MNEITAQLTSPLPLIVLGSVAPSLAALWLRLWWRTRHERARRKTLVTLVRSMPAGGRLEEHAADGSSLVVTVDSVDSAQV